MILIDICEKQSNTFTGIIVIHFYRTVFIYYSVDGPSTLLYSVE